MKVGRKGSRKTSSAPSSPTHPTSPTFPATTPLASGYAPAGPTFPDPTLTPADTPASPSSKTPADIGAAVPSSPPPYSEELPHISPDQGQALVSNLKSFIEDSFPGSSMMEEHQVYIYMYLIALPNLLYIVYFYCSMPTEHFHYILDFVLYCILSCSFEAMTIICHRL